jgi:hypothetical protein
MSGKLTLPELSYVLVSAIEIENELKVKKITKIIMYKFKRFIFNPPLVKSI